MRRSDWVRITKREYYFEKINDEDFVGAVGLIKMLEVRQPLIVECFGEQWKLVEKDYKWLQFAFEGKHYWLTVMFDENDKIIQYYYDISLENHVEPNGDSWFIDLILDVAVNADGRIQVLDADELDEALENGFITREQHDLAHSTADALINEIKGNVKRLESFCLNYFRILNMKARNVPPQVISP